MTLLSLQLISQIYTMQVLEPNCGITSLGSNERGLDQRSLIKNPAGFLPHLGKKSTYYCHVSLFFSYSCAIAKLLIPSQVRFNDK